MSGSAKAPASFPADGDEARPTHSNIFVSTDQFARMDNPDSDHHIICATSVKDVEEFEGLVGTCEGLGFRKAVSQRHEILDMARPLIDRVYYVAVRKMKDDYTFHETERIHEAAFRYLADMVMRMEDGHYTDVEISQDLLIDDDVAESVFRNSPHAHGRSVDANVVEMDDSYGLQANSFVCGPIAMKYARDDTRYYDYLDSPTYGFVTTTDDVEEWVRANRGLHDHVDASGPNVRTSSDYENADGGSHE